jgi:hypothetical protein
MHTATDVEIHEVNGKYYALDFARLMPPEAPLSKSKYPSLLFSFSQSISDVEINSHNKRMNIVVVVDVDVAYKISQLKGKSLHQV